jgi:hypothetical protein
MLATATAISAGSLGILAGVGVALAAAALGFQIAQTIKITVEMNAARDRLKDLENSIERLKPFGGFGGVASFVTPGGRTG